MSISLNTIQAVDSSNWKTQRVGDVDFKIAPEFDNAQPYNNDIYYRTNVSDFSLRKMNDSLLEINYASDICSGNLIKMENKTLADHSTVILYVKSNSKDNMTAIYFTSRHSIYCLTFNGTNISSNVKEMIKNSPESTLSNKSFHDQLNEVLTNYIVYEGKDYNEYEQYYLDNFSYENFKQLEDNYYREENDYYNDNYYNDDNYYFNDYF